MRARTRGSSRGSRDSSSSHRRRGSITMRSWWPSTGASRGVQYRVRDRESRRMQGSRGGQQVHEERGGSAAGGSVKGE
jgi:hypothetical protein